MVLRESSGGLKRGGEVSTQVSECREWKRGGNAIDRIESLKINSRHR